jgi:O-antigen/teichoic acid export membrane protein
MRMLSQALSWVITILVIRLLSPSDYGLLAMATVFMGMLNLVAEAGLGPAMIQARNVDEVTLRRIFGAVIAIDSLLFLIQVSAAPLVAHIFDEIRLVPIIQVLAFQFLVMIFTVIPGALLSRQLDFKGQSIVSLVSAICASVTSLGLALGGFGVWSLVVSSLVGALVNAIGLNLLTPYLCRPDFSPNGMRSLFSVGAQITAARALYFIYSQADIFVAGRLLGKELLGFYSIALHLASLPVQRISSIVNQIAFSAFAEAQQDPESVAQHLIRGIRMLSILSIPILWAMSSTAPELTAVLLGPTWQAAVTPMQLLPLVMPVAILSPYMNTAFQGIGRVSVVLSNAVTASLILPLAFLIGTHWDLLGLSLAWLIAYPAVFLINMIRMLPLVRLKARDIWLAVAPPVLAGIGMYICVLATRSILPQGLPSAATLASLIGVAAASYISISLLTNRAGVREVIDVFRK